MSATDGMSGAREETSHSEWFRIGLAPAISLPKEGVRSEYRRGDKGISEAIGSEKFPTNVRESSPGSAGGGVAV
jgi:hypothetical protein